MGSVANHSLLLLKNSNDAKKDAKASFWRPDATNAAEFTNFKKMFDLVFAKVPIFAKKPPPYREHVMQFQLFLMKQRHLQLRAKSATRRDVHEYVWHCMKTASKSSDRQAIVLHMLGDFKRYALPSGRKDKD